MATQHPATSPTRHGNQPGNQQARHMHGGQPTRTQLRKVKDQVIVITGATSGIGLATARMAARRGARLVLAARNEQALQELVDEIRSHGGEAVALTVDVSREEDVRKIANAAREKFGGFDTWINNAAVSMYGRLLDVPLEDERHLFDTNYWGVVHGSRVAVDHLRQHGGALINIGSANSDYAAPLQGSYSASKHAVKGYTDALRMELEEEGAPVSVTLVKPSPIDTPYTRHARNHMDKAPKLTPPVYAPEVAAEAILFCAEHPKRDIYVGGGGRFFALAGRLAPKLSDRFMSWMGFAMQKRNAQHRQSTSDSLYKPGADGQERGDYSGHVMRSSAYTKVAMHPKRTGAVLLATGIAAGLLWRAKKRRKAASLGAHALAHTGAFAKESRKLAHRGKKVVDALPQITRDVQRSVERNLPRL